MSPFRTACLLLALACAGAGAARAETVLRASEANHYMGNFPTYAAIDGGMFARRGITLQIFTMKGGPIAANALLSGDVDIMDGSADQAVKVRAKGQDMRIIGSLMQRQSYAVVVPKDVAWATPQDLKGQTIAVTAVGSASDVATRAWLIGAGLDPTTDPRIVGLGSSPTVVAAFQHGQVKVATASPPALTRLLEIGRVLHDMRNEPYQEGAIMIRGADLAGPRADLMRAVVAATIEAQARLHDDDSFALEVGHKEFPEFSPETLQRLMAETIHTYDAISHGAVVTPESYANVLTSLTRIKAIDHEVPFAEVVDERFLK